MPIKYAFFENNITADPDDYMAMVQISGSADGDAEGRTRPRRERPGLKVCVSCRSIRVQSKRVSVRLRDGRKVTGVRAEVCAACGERYFDLEAMRQLETEGTDDE